MTIEANMRTIAAYPPQVRWARPQINKILGRPDAADISLEIERFYVSEHPDARLGAGIYPKAMPIEDFCTTTQVELGRILIPGEVTFLTEDRPSAIVQAIARPPRIPSVSTYVAERGLFAFSVAANIPIVFHVEDSSPRIVSEISSPYAEAIGIAGGKRLWEVPADVIDDVLLIHDEFVGTNFAHWFLDWFPRFKLLERCGADWSRTPVILTRPPARFQTEMLASLGIEKSNCIIAGTNPDRPGRFIAFRSFFAASTSGIGYRHALHGGSRWAAAFLRSKFLKDGVNRHMKLVLNRRHNRRLVLDEPTWELLNKAGFGEVFTDDLSFADQVSLFQSATWVVSVHGAGLSNIVFCESGTKVLEVFPPGYSLSSFWMVADSVNLDYTCAVGQIGDDGSKSDLHVRDRDIACARDIVESWLASTA